MSRPGVRQLMAKIQASETHYVRCIKPNAQNRPKAGWGLGRCGDRGYPPVIKRGQLGNPPFIVDFPLKPSLM